MTITNLSDDQGALSWQPLLAHLIVSSGKFLDSVKAA
jgi:hypothetical protein